MIETVDKKYTRAVKKLNEGYSYNDMKGITNGKYVYEQPLIKEISLKEWGN